MMRVGWCRTLGKYRISRGCLNRPATGYEVDDVTPRPEVIQ